MVFIDYLIGTIIDSIKEKGWWEETLFIFTTDNGGDQDFEDVDIDLSDWEGMNDYNNKHYSSNLPFRGSKGTYYEGGIRLITAISGGWLDEEYQGTVDFDRHHVSDFTVTLLDVAQYSGDLDKTLDGKNFFTDNHNEALVVNIAPLTPISWMIIPSNTMGTCVFYGDYKYIALSLGYTDVNLDTLTGSRNVTNNSTGYVDSDRDDCWGVGDDGISFVQGCLYNIAEDPGETINLWEERLDVVQEVQQIITTEFFGFDYHPGQNMEQDDRSNYVNFERLGAVEPLHRKFLMFAWIDQDE